MYIVKVYDGSLRWLAPVERCSTALGGIDPEEDQHWTALRGRDAALQRRVHAADLRGAAPASTSCRSTRSGCAAVPDRQAFETAASFTTNTNWQSYSGESTMSYFSQMNQLAFHNFISAAAGMAVAVALARGIARRSAGRLGNFWADLVRGTLYIFLPLSFVSR